MQPSAITASLETDSDCAASASSNAPGTVTTVMLSSDTPFFARHSRAPSSSRSVMSPLNSATTIANRRPDAFSDASGVFRLPANVSPLGHRGWYLVVEIEQVPHLRLLGAEICHVMLVHTRL